MAMNCPPHVMQAKIFLRRNGWTWNRKLRRWELATPNGPLVCRDAMQAMASHPTRAEKADENAQ